jgi:hypothetical protein
MVNGVLYRRCSRFESAEGWFDFDADGVMASCQFESYSAGHCMVVGGFAGTQRLFGKLFCSFGYSAKL